MTVSRIKFQIYKTRPKFLFWVLFVLLQARMEGEGELGGDIFINNNIYKNITMKILMTENCL